MEAELRGPADVGGRPLHPHRTLTQLGRQERDGMALRKGHEGGGGGCSGGDKEVVVKGLKWW